MPISVDSVVHGSFALMAFIGAVLWHRKVSWTRFSMPVVSTIVLCGFAQAVDSLFGHRWPTTTGAFVDWSLRLFPAVLLCWMHLRAKDMRREESDRRRTTRPVERRVMHSNS